MKYSIYQKLDDGSTWVMWYRNLSLTYWGRDKMAAISQTTFSNAISWIKMYKFRLKFHWSLFPRVQSTIFQHWFRWWLGAVQATSHYRNRWCSVYWRIYASPGLNEFTQIVLQIRHYDNPRICNHMKTNFWELAKYNETHSGPRAAMPKGFFLS